MVTHTHVVLVDLMRALRGDSISEFVVFANDSFACHSYPINITNSEIIERTNQMLGHTPKLKIKHKTQQTKITHRMRTEFDERLDFRV